MITTGRNSSVGRWLRIFFATGLLASFFLPWVAWKETLVSGYYLPAGKFFQISATQFKLDNPFPQLNFTFYIFWLIPVLAALVVILSWLNKKNYWFCVMAGVLALSLVTIFYFFTKTLIDLGVGENVFNMLRLPVYIAVLCSTGLILTAGPAANPVTKAAWILAGPVFAFLAFMIIEKKVWSETHTDTAKATTDFTLSATELIKEFAANDSAANNKYREKILVISGVVSQTDQHADSTVNIRFTDSSKYFINISLDKAEFPHTKNIKPGDQVSVKGSCSGSSYSMILDSTTINFKRCTLIKNTEK